MTTSIFLDFAIRWRSKYSTVVIFDSRGLTFVDSALRFTNDCFLFVQTTKPTLNAFGVFRTIWRSRPPRWWSRPGWETSVTSLWCLTSFWWPHQLDISFSRSEFYCCERIWFCFGSIRLIVLFFAVPLRSETGTAGLETKTLCSLLSPLHLDLKLYLVPTNR